MHYFDLRAYLCFMQDIEKALVIDAGNTRIKVAVFYQGELQQLLTFENQFDTAFSSFAMAHQDLPTILASVLSENATQELQKLFSKALLFSAELKLPISVLYETPFTLGVDRLANAIAAHHISHKNALVIDIGTCIKYDFINSKGEYIGGAISPGINQRYEAMHQFTGKLPLVTDRLNASELATNTLDALRSGVMNGIKHEIDGFMAHYTATFPQLTIFLTGGDHQHFDFGSKSGIFADENLTLKGLLIALKHVYA